MGLSIYLFSFYHRPYGQQWTDTFPGSRCWSFFLLYMKFILILKKMHKIIIQLTLIELIHQPGNAYKHWLFGLYFDKPPLKSLVPR